MMIFKTIIPTCIISLYQITTLLYLITIIIYLIDIHSFSVTAS